MLRGGPQTSVQGNVSSKQQQQQQLLQQQQQLLLQQQQRQKKRLSFRNPEVEGPQKNNNSFLGGCRSKTLARPTSARQKVAITRKHSSSFEDLTLEDQAQHIAHHVGNAFSDLSLEDGDRRNFRESVLSGGDKETEILDCSPPQEDIPNYQPRFKISPEDEEFLDALVPPLLDDLETMRGPASESEDAPSSQNCIPMESAYQEVISSSSMQHQIQMLKYQVDQQNQQTQMALHQIQLLQDQMGAESAARRKAQEQNNQLMQQNTDLLNHMEKLFLQIEELEKQVQLLEQEKRCRRTITNHQQQVTSVRQPMSYAAHRRQSTEQEKSALQNRLSYSAARSTEQEKPALQTRSSYTAARKNSLTLTKPMAIASKPSTTQNSVPASISRKNPIMPQKTYGAQNKNTDPGTKVKETLRIGDLSPAVQRGALNPFNSAWKLKSTESNNPEASTDKTAENSAKNRAASLSNYIKKAPQEATSVKSTLFGSGSSISSTGTTNKKYSSSTSDLYSSPSTLQAKSSLLIEEPATGVRGAVSSLSINSTTTTSKLPRYQPYTGWQRRTSLTNDSEPISGIGKDSYKNTSLFNR